MKVILLNPETEETYDEAVEIIAKRPWEKRIFSEQYFTYRKDLFAKYVQEEEEQENCRFCRKRYFRSLRQRYVSK